MKFCNDLMNTKNNCSRWQLPSGWQLPSFKHRNSEEALDFEHLRNLYSFLYFQLGIFSCELGKKEDIFNWEYDPILAIKLAQKIPGMFLGDWYSHAQSTLFLNNSHAHSTLFLNNSHAHSIKLTSHLS